MEIQPLPEAAGSEFERIGSENSGTIHEKVISRAGVISIQAEYLAPPEHSPADKKKEWVAHSPRSIAVFVSVDRCQSGRS
jgi:hypothetical protein